MYLKRFRNFRLLFVALILSVALLAAQFTEPALAQGKLITDTITSPSLEGNLMGDPATRNMTIYLPPSYEEGGNFPVVYLLHGYGGNEGSFATADSPYLPESGLSGMLDDLIAVGELKEIIIVTPNGSNKYGGSMYTNSGLTGNYETYIAQDIVSHIDAHYRTIPSRDSRAIAGGSMGGYGAMKLAMKHPDVFGAVASHSGPLYFDAMKPMIPATIAENPDGMMGPHPEKQLTTFAYGMSAAFSPNLEDPPFFVDLPFEYPSPEVIDEVWDRWLEHDTFTMLSNYGGNLASLRGVYLDCGDGDELGITPHAIAFHQALADAGIEHEYEIFAGGHGDKFYERLPISLKFLSDVLISTDDLEANKAIRLRLFEEVWNQGNVDVIDEIYAEDFVGDYGDNEGFKQFIAATFDAIPDVHVTLEDIFAEGDLVATRYTFTGTHQGEFMGIPPTGVKGPMTGVSIARVVDGRIQKVWDNDDFLALMQQWGVIPSTREGYAWGAPSEVTGDPGDAETNKAIVLRVIDEIWLQGNLELADEFIHPNHHFNEAPGGPSSWGIDAYKGNITLWHSILSDMHTNIDAILAEGDKVAIHVTNTGTHTGTLFGIPATMKQLEFSLTAIMRIADGKIVETWMVKDSMGIIEQLQQLSVTEANKAVRRRHYEEVWNQGKLDVLDEISSPDRDWGDYGNKEAFKQEVITRRAAFPDLHFTIEDMIAEGDLVTTRYTQTGTHKGEFIGIPPTGRHGAMTGISIARMVDGKIVKIWENTDMLGAMQQLGVIPSEHEEYTWGEPLEITGDPGDPDTNKSIVLRIAVEVWNQGNLDVADELIHPDHFLNEAGYPMRDLDTLKKAVTEWHSDLPDFHVNIDMILAEGDKVVTRWTARGTHTGTDLMGLPATGKRLEFTGITINRIADGKAVESWWVVDRMTLMQQLTTEPSEDFSNVFFTSLSPGLNMISLPLKPQTPYTARSFVEELYSTVVIKLDEARQRFVGFTLDAPDDGFAIEGGKGYIVNVPESKVATFTGAAWTNQPPVEAAPSLVGANPLWSPNGAWAFVVSGRFFDDFNDSLKKDGYLIAVKNTRTNAVTTDVIRSGYFAAAFADLNRKNVVETGDRLEVQVRNQAGEIVSDTLHYTVTTEAIRQAFMPIILKNVEIPRQSLLLPNYPNPFNPETWIPYQIREPADVVIRIYNSQGQLVRTLDLGQRAAGFYLGHTRAAHWDGLNLAGEKVASGIYFYQLQAGDFSSTRRMLVLK